MSVVKRTTRTLKADGTDSIEIKFIIAHGTNLRQRSETSVHRRRMSVANREKREMPCDSELEDAEEEPQLGDDATGANMTLKMGIINTKAKRGRDELDFENRAGAESEFSLRRQASFSRRGTAEGVVDRNARLPQVQFAAELEATIMEQWRLKRTFPFISPIDYQLFPLYRIKVPNPIWLSEIRQKVGRFEYRTLDAFIADFELLASNAVLYNGPTAKLSLDAAVLLKAVHASVNHNRDHGLPDKLRLLEDVIKQRENHFAQQRRR